MLVAYLMEEERKKLEKMYQKLGEDDADLKKWNQALILKAILLFPLIAFALTFLKINFYKSIMDLLGFVAFSGLFVLEVFYLIIFYSKESNGKIYSYKQG